jgi:ribosomal-protein-alanine N-acetyltransferase
MPELAKTLARHRRAWRRDEAYNFLVFPRGAARLLGRVSLVHVARGVWQNAHVGYLIDEAEQGKGLTTEAVGAVIRFAFETLHLHRLQAAIMPRNAKSIRVIEKLGFRNEGLALRFLKIAGRWEDHFIFARTADEEP